MHRPIKKYTQSGEIRDDSDIPRLRLELERMMIEVMRDSGYLPVHDITPQFSTLRIGNKYQFVLTIYACFAGKKKAKDFDFWFLGRLVKHG